MTPVPGGAKMVRRFRLVKQNTPAKPAVRRLARRGGVKRISGSLYDEVRTEARNMLFNALHGAVMRADHSRRRTVNVRDVLQQLESQGKTLYFA